MVYLLDIEGTCLPGEYVFGQMFPYARKRLDTMGPLTADEERQLFAEHSADVAAGQNPAPLTVPYLHWLMDRDRKSTALKSVQGRLWEAGFLGGELNAPVFDDVPEALRRWQGSGHRSAIFSSGSIFAQRLLFGHTTHGDLTPLLSGYFDTTTGPKKEARSYRAIADQLGVPTSDVLFVSDVVAELDAAASAGMPTALAVRPGNAPVVEECAHPRVKTFDSL